MATVLELGYLGIEATDLAAWRRFAVDLLGLQAGAERAGGSLALRLDDRAHRLLVSQGAADDMVFAGYDCGNEATLEALAARLRDAGMPVEAQGDEVARARGVRRLLATRDPAGNRVELYVELARTAQPFKSELVPSGFVTANGGLGHLFLPTLDRQARIDFYTLLGFRLSDYIRQEIAPGMVVDAAFMHCNGLHHTLAFVGFQRADA